MTGPAAPLTDPDATRRLWGRLRRPFDTPEVVDAALGLPEEVIDQLIGSRLASGEAAERLLARMPIISRALSTDVQKRPERCMGEVRGPVLWSETMAARGASAGAPDVFVCAVPRRHYDTQENRLLVAALVAIRDAGRATDALPADAYDDDVLRRARSNGHRATRWLGATHLQQVARTRPTPREIRRVRAGSRTRTYAPALRVLAEVLEPLAIEDLLPYCDRRTTAHHGLVMALVDRLEVAGVRVPQFRARDGVLRAGPLEYRHPRIRGAGDGLHGVLVSGLLVDLMPTGTLTRRDVAAESLAARAGGRPSILVSGEDDLDAIVAQVADAVPGSGGA